MRRWLIRGGCVFMAWVASILLAGCGGGGGGSNPTSPTSPIATGNGGNSNAGSPPLPSIKPILANSTLIVKATRTSPGTQARPRFLARIQGHAADVSGDVIEEELVFDANGDPDLTQSLVADLTRPIQGIITAASVSDDGTFSETFQFSGAASETDTVSGTLAQTSSGITLQHGTDALTINGVSTTQNFLFTGPVENAGTPVDLSKLGLSPITFSGNATATDAAGNTLTNAVLSITLGSDGSYFGALTYTDATGQSGSQTILGQINAGGDDFGTYTTDDSQTFSEEISMAGVPSAPSSAAVSGAFFDQNGNVLVSYSGSLAPAPAATPSLRQKHGFVRVKPRHR